VRNEVARIGDQRPGIRAGFAAAPAGGVLGMEPVTDLTERALVAGRDLLVVVPLVLPPGCLVVPVLAGFRDWPSSYQEL
jgi:hypothetical protein